MQSNYDLSYFCTVFCLTKMLYNKNVLTSIFYGQSFSVSSHRDTTAWWVRLVKTFLTWCIWFTAALSWWPFPRIVGHLLQHESEDAIDNTVILSTNCIKRKCMLPRHLLYVTGDKTSQRKDQLSFCWVITTKFVLEKLLCSRRALLNESDHCLQQNIILWKVALEGRVIRAVANRNRAHGVLTNRRPFLFFLMLPIQPL